MNLYEKREIKWRETYHMKRDLHKKRICVAQITRWKKTCHVKKKRPIMWKETYHEKRDLHKKRNYAVQVPRWKKTCHVKRDLHKQQIGVTKKKKTY